jgi:hypothetical protein
MKRNYYLFLILISFFLTVQKLSASSQADIPDFIDLARIKPQDRKPQSQIIQFCYTSELNIGDYLPTLGIRGMLEQGTDLWNIKDRNIDFDFINSHYKCAIIGGAGILSKRSEHFYRAVLQGCKIPMIIWGVGMCLPEGNIQISEGINKQVAQELESRCDLINVRDDLTANYYGFKNASISVCPTIAYLQKFIKFVNKNSQRILYSSHDNLVPNDENIGIIAALQEASTDFKKVNNIFSAEKKISEIENIIMEYCNSKIVVTTRLHGAIIAYSLGIPYIIIPFDEKLRAFHRKYGNGVIANTLQELQSFLRNQEWIDLINTELNPVLEFGKKAKAWVQNYCSTDIIKKDL